LATLNGVPLATLNGVTASIKAFCSLCKSSVGSIAMPARPIGELGI
jgi:hypothetical protein